MFTPRSVIGFARSISLATLCIASIGCHHPEYPLVGSMYVPGATGDVQVEKADHGKTLVTIVIDELPAPPKVGTGMQTYVMWTRPSSANATAKNEGECAYSTKLRQAKGAILTSERRFRLLVTAEANKDAAAPSDLIIVEREIKRD